MQNNQAFKSMFQMTEKRKLFPESLTHWDWKRWNYLSDSARKLDDALSCCDCNLRGVFHLCDCEQRDYDRWLNDLLYVRRFQPPCIRPVNRFGCMVMHPLGFVMGPYTYQEWLSGLAYQE